jgi:hypothetical protein
MSGAGSKQLPIADRRLKFPFEIEKVGEDGVCSDAGMPECQPECTAGENIRRVRVLHLSRALLG